MLLLLLLNAADSRVNKTQVAEGTWVEAGQVIAAQAVLKQRQAELAKTQKGEVEVGPLAEALLPLPLLFPML